MDRSHQHGAKANPPLPRYKRSRLRAKEDRGLPNDAELADLAKAYLEIQRKHWPQLVANGLIPEITDALISEMVNDFKRRHREIAEDFNARAVGGSDK